MAITERIFGLTTYHIDENRTLQGAYTRRSKNGRVVVVGEYLNGNAHGEWFSWHSGRRGLKSRSTYDNGAIITHERWSRRGILVESIEFTSGGTGLARKWFSDGTPKCEEIFVEGVRHGEYKRWGIQDRSKIKNGIYVNGRRMVGIKVETLSDKDKLVLSLKHGIQWL